MRRVRTFVNELRSMRPFASRRVPAPEGDTWANLDEHLHVVGIVPGVAFVYNSAPGGHFRSWWFAFGNRKLGCFDIN